MIFLEMSDKLSWYFKRCHKNCHNIFRDDIETLIIVFRDVRENSRDIFRDVRENSRDIFRNVRETLMIFLEMSEKLSWYF